MKQRLLDLFCGAGGAAMGYHRAGFDVVGVDIKPQPRYPFEFIQADAMTFPLEGFDAIHASPPCQAYSIGISPIKGRSKHPELVEPVRARMMATDGPYVIENVVGAPLRVTFVLCGASLGLTATDDDGALLVLRRHRLFESNVGMLQPQCACRDFVQRGYMIAGAYGGGPQNRQKAAWKNSRGRRGGYTPSAKVRGELMGIEWMRGKEVNEAIPLPTPNGSGSGS